MQTVVALFIQLIFIVEFSQVLYLRERIQPHVQCSKVNFKTFELVLVIGKNIFF